MSETYSGGGEKRVHKIDCVFPRGRSGVLLVARFPAHTRERETCGCILLY